MFTPGTVFPLVPTPPSERLGRSQAAGGRPGKGGPCRVPAACSIVSLHSALAAQASSGFGRFRALGWSRVNDGGEFHSQMKVSEESANQSYRTPITGLQNRIPWYCTPKRLCRYVLCPLRSTTAIRSLSCGAQHHTHTYRLELCESGWGGGPRLGRVPGRREVVLCGCATRRRREAHRPMHSLIGQHVTKVIIRMVTIRNKVVIIGRLVGP